MYIHIFTYIYIMNSEYGEWKLVRSQFSQRVSAVAVSMELFSFENESDLEIIYLTSLVSKVSFYCRLLPSCSSTVKYEL